jgi:hypothetical protein
MDRSVIGPQQNHVNRELTASRIRREKERINHLPEVPDYIEEAGQRVKEITQEWVTRALLEVSKKYDGVFHDDPGGQRRKLASSLEQLSKEIKEYIEPLERDQTKWQKEGGKIRDDIRKLADKAVELYQAYVEYPPSDNYEKYGGDKAKASGDRNSSISFRNQAIALYFWNALKDLEKLTITDKAEFKEAQHFLNTLQAKMSDSADLGKAARECEKQARLAELQIAPSQKRDSEVHEHSEYIQNLSNGIGGKSRLLRQLKAGYVKDYSEQAKERVKELEEILEHVKKRRQETGAKIDAYASQARKRFHAINEHSARQIALYRMLAPSTTRATNAQDRTTNATNRAAAIPIEHNPYEELKDAINARDANVINIQIQRAIINARGEARRARIRAEEARIRAEEARIRAEEARIRAEEAGTRSKIAKAYNINDISDQAARDVENHAKKIEEWEKEVIKNACSIESYNISIKSESESIIGYLRQMRGLRVQAVLTDADRSELTKFVTNIEKSETAKNNAIAFEAKSTIAEQTAIGRVSDELPNELAALRREQPTETAISNLGTQDPERLQDLVDRQRALEETLTGTPAVGDEPAVLGLIELERNHSHAVRDIEQAILNGTDDIENLKATEAASRWEVAIQRADFRAALRQVRAAERAAAEVLKRNAIHKEGDVKGDAEQAIERLQKIKDNLADQDDEGLKNRSKGHIFIDPKLGKATINGVWTSIREIDGWEPRDPNSDQTTVRYRPDIVKIEIETITREAQGGKLSVEPIYTKRLSERYFRSTEFEYTLVVDGNSFANGGRRTGVLTIVDLKKQDGTTSKPEALHAETGQRWTPEEYTTRKEIPMEAAGTIRIKENHNNQSNAVETIFSTHIETMPAPDINHAEALALKQGEGWSDEDKRRMCKFDLDRRVLILPNGLEFPMDKFDWTETKWDEVNGVTLQYKGPKELSQVNLLTAGSSDIFDEKLLDATTAVEEKKRKHLEEGIELLKQAIKSYDEGKINDIIGYIRSNEGVESYQSSVAKNELERPPKNGDDLKALKEKKKEQRDAQTSKSVAHSMESAAGMLGATQSYGEVVKKHIRTIHENDPLSAKHVWKSHANRGKYALDKHRSSQRKQELRDEIRAAHHLDKTVHFQLLEDPKRGPAGANSPVKNATPNGLELLQEYNRYANQLGIDNQFANQIERQNVAQYVANIETEFQTNLTIHPYYANQYYLEKAMDAARDGNFLSKEVDGNYIIGASEYIRKLKQVDHPLPSDKSLAGLRQADEYHWVTYLREALAEADREGMVELLKQALPLAKQTQECRYSNLKRAEKALDLETPSEEAKKIVDDMHTVEPSLLWPKIGEKPAAVGKDKKSDGKFDPKAITKKSDSELAQEAGEVAEKIYKHAVNAIERLIASITDPGEQQKFREKVAELTMDLAKREFEINNQDKSIQNQWQKLEVYIKVMNKQRWKDLWKELMLLWLKTSVESGSKGVQSFMSELEKIVTKAVS